MEEEIKLPLVILSTSALLQVGHLPHNRGIVRCAIQIHTGTTPLVRNLIPIPHEELPSLAFPVSLHSRISRQWSRKSEHLYTTTHLHNLRPLQNRCVRHVHRIHTHFKSFTKCACERGAHRAHANSAAHSSTSTTSAAYAAARLVL